MVRRQSINEFLQTLWVHYDQHARRELPWRHTTDVYRVLVSEIMLQQTQVGRVVPKYEAFIQRFPNAQSLATAPLSDVLVLWNGLGYNRRAKYLHEAAKIMNEQEVTSTVEGLVRLPGVGVNTAGAICAYAYNQPVIFIETNIRTVLLYHFFKSAQAVTDAELREVLGKIIAQVDNPREFYWAMMDYGSWLKTAKDTGNRQSKHYTKQSPFEGSRRQVRGAVLRLLTRKQQSMQELQQHISDQRLRSVLEDQCQEGLIIHKAGKYRLGADTDSGVQ
ncbi:A/G-specific adenine glycosylase [Candidatus Saccharibacteria bacterium]|nr:A/G-specific adenine glycosylase [Candidatus Saccharibacteria bacterium]